MGDGGWGMELITFGVKLWERKRPACIGAGKMPPAPYTPNPEPSWRSSGVVSLLTLC
jgi:hypothetical protein